ncbi:hypothetical protein Cycma_1196 [Cyclobacterium marinum DSM 745]|uniref:Uncharacterized protein n=1 Tax=Cyclobacterium marinum (strain ATCC 25205 / DSM 745 / LMG 13164 / NCIMB 1802) TaxID=880070 RepID=G0IY64_CYCMS|nr:hypothetical protein Cycma_1196 [Cyclobacterium marinum DSM 745]
MWLIIFYIKPKQYEYEKHSFYFNPGSGIVNR